MGVITFVVTMPIKTKIRKIGNSYGIVLPKEALHTLKVEEGSTVYLTEAPNNTLNINPGRPGFDEKMRLAESLMKRYRNTYSELAK
jgi:putative addiction module antidote